MNVKYLLHMIFQHLCYKRAVRVPEVLELQHTQTPGSFIDKQFHMPTYVQIHILHFISVFT